MYFRLLINYLIPAALPFGFNLMSKVDNPGGILVGYESEVIMRHCRGLTGNVVLHEGYFEDDFTVWMYR